MLFVFGMAPLASAQSTYGCGEYGASSYQENCSATSTTGGGESSDKSEDDTDLDLFDDTPGGFTEDGGTGSNGKGLSKLVKIILYLSLAMAGLGWFLLLFWRRRKKDEEEQPPIQL